MPISFNLENQLLVLFTQCNQSYQGHQELSGKSDENKSFKSNQLAPSIYIMIELCFFSLDQWEIRIHLLWGKCFNIPHHCDPHLNQTKWLIFNDLLPLTIPGVLGKYSRLLSVSQTKAEKKTVVKTAEWIIFCSKQSGLQHVEYLSGNIKRNFSLQT